MSDGTRITKRCAVCSRFGAYAPDDGYCVSCGHQELHDACACGRDFGYALVTPGDLHCPRCGVVVRGKSKQFE